jgi:DinB superfamily
VPDLEAILEKLARAQRDLLSAADSVPPDHWKISQSNCHWCAAQLVAHLITVERSVIAKADRVLQHPPKPVAFWKRFHLPFALVEKRVIRRKTPMPLDLQLIREKEEMLAELRHVRERTLAFIEETRGRNLSQYRWRHPFLGSFNVHGWIAFIASHQIRHAKQMREIVSALPKAIEGLQK